MGMASGCTAGIGGIHARRAGRARAALRLDGFEQRFAREERAQLRVREVAAFVLAVAHDVPVVPGTTEPLGSAAEAIEVAQRYGFPVLLKAAAG